MLYLYVRDKVVVSSNCIEEENKIRIKEDWIYRFQRSYIRKLTLKTFIIDFTV